MKNSLKTQGYAIYDANFKERPEKVGTPIQANFIFKYRGFKISASSAGFEENDAMNSVLVFDENNNDAGIFDTVENAIEHINKIKYL